jgi:hypothetical protein
MFHRRYERRSERLAPLNVFIWRLISSVGIACGMIASALSLGIAGYHWLGGFDWLDSLLEASMILGGMGPVNPLKSDTAKLFASFYALFSGLIFIGIMGVALAPLAHRMMHKFHVDEDDIEKEPKTAQKSQKKK